MNNFDDILEQCLDRIASGEATVAECLARNPQHAAELEPILGAAHRLQRGQDAKPSPFFAARLRSELMQKARAKETAKRGSPIFFRRMALNMAVLVLAFVFVTTAFAQSALPGQALYNWKLTSERVWRVVSMDPVGAELEISNRRVNEYVADSQDEARRARVVNSYEYLLVRLQTEDDELERIRILRELKSQQDSLRKVGISIPQLDEIFSGGAVESDGNFSDPESPVTRPTPKP